jgi:hypothetical protein
MPRNGVPPSLIPYGADETVYLVVDRSAASDRADDEIAVERTDLEIVIRDLMSGQFNDPMRIIAFNTLEHWSHDVSAEVAAEIQTRCDIDREPVPEHVKDFVAQHAEPARRVKHTDATAQNAVPQSDGIALTGS